MKVEVYIDDPIPANVGLSYGDMEFGKFGVCCFRYANDYMGPVHWINWRKSVFRPEYPDPIGFRAWFATNVIGVVVAKADTYANVPGFDVGTVHVNLLTGDGVPVKSPV